MEESQNFGHQHPLELLNEEQIISNKCGEAECWKCGEKVSAPSFSCLEKCGFYLHKICAEAPLEINHPFHRDHPLLLLQNSPYVDGECICDFCNKSGKKFVYHCSCGLDFHIKCALFTYNIAEKNLKEFEHVALQDPFISTENDGEEIKDVRKCFGCWEPLANYTYFSIDCGFNIHKKCVELPFKMNHMCHRKHSLVLQFNAERLVCKICQKTPEEGFVYCCSICKFVVHIECVSPPPIVEDKSYQHPFTLFWGLSSFICDACGTEGNLGAYICSICNIIVHKKCISLPRIIKSMLHDHRVFHTHFIQEDDHKSWDCIICHNEVDTERGSYYCADCNIILHVNCATKSKYWYDIVSVEDEDDELALLSDISNNSISIIERNEAGEATKIKHFKHMHNLMLSDKIVEYDDKCCDGCMLLITASFYYCSECEFFLHKACAELPKMKHFWGHTCRKPLILISDCIVRCYVCGHQSNAFAYKCSKCEDHFCLRCVTKTTGPLTCPGHEHPLFFYHEYEEQCSDCGKDIKQGFRCKDCNFALDYECISLPVIARHKCDEHFLELTYHDDNDYSKSHYCDICEERRDPSRWFYHCATCDTSAHIKCVLGKYPFIKLGGIYETEDHPHPLTFVKKIYYYPDCMERGEPCQDVSLECATSGCNYIVHLECIEDPFDLRPIRDEESKDEGVIGQDA